jgi:hypothetical protein
MGTQPFASAPKAGVHVVPAGHWYPSVEQLATAQPLRSAPARVGAHVRPFGHARSGPQVFGLQRPVVVSQISTERHEVLVQRAVQIVDGPPVTLVKLQWHGSGTGTQTSSAEQPPSPEH